VRLAYFDWFQNPNRAGRKGKWIYKNIFTQKQISGSTIIKHASGCVLFTQNYLYYSKSTTFLSNISGPLGGFSATSRVFVSGWIATVFLFKKTIEIGKAVVTNSEGSFRDTDLFIREQARGFCKPQFIEVEGKCQARLRPKNFIDFDAINAEFADGDIHTQVRV
jgi:hypothetical protein